MTVSHHLRPSRWIMLFCLLSGLLPAAEPVPAAERLPATFEQRIANRADRIMARLALADADQAGRVREKVLQFYRNLHAVHAGRDAQLAAAPAGDIHGLNRINFESDKRAAAVAGEFIGTLARSVDAAHVEAVQDWMTFDLVALTVAEYDRMFPSLEERHRARLRAWLVESREQAVIAGSAETKLDVFRVNKLRMNAYLRATGLDVDSAVAEELRRRAATPKTD